jgi:hypothetical protein
MPFPVLGSNSAVAGFEIDNSLRFNRDDNAYLEKTFSGSPTSTKICTISFWLKLADPSVIHAKAIFSAIKSGTSEDVIKFGGLNSGLLGYIEFALNNTSDGALAVGDGSSLNFFRDPSAWYHFVIAFDTSQGTASNRIKFYQNGTLLQTESRIEGGSVIGDIPITQNYDLGFLTASKHQIGMNVESANSESFDGYLSEFYFIDGQQLAPTEFAETNDNGVWIPKTYEGTYGNYGFFLEFQDSGSLGTDTSGNGNNFTPTNLTATDQTTDTPTNNWCTLNPLSAGSDLRANGSFAEGNTDLTNGGTSGQGNGQKCQGTMGFANGKWYWEVKLVSNTASIGIVDSNIQTSSDISLSGKNATNYDSASGNVVNSGGVVYTGSTYGGGDIISIAVDADNGFVYFAKNGTYQNSGDPTSGSSGTGGASFTTGDFMLPLAADNSSGSAGRHQYNFGNAPFTISSGNSDANGYGNFEYAVPSGYYSLCTKNLAEYG